VTGLLRCAIDLSIHVRNCHVYACPSLSRICRSATVTYMPDRHCHVYAGPPLSRICQSATVTYMPDRHCHVYSSPPLQNNIKTRHTSTKAARRLARALCHPGSTFQPQTPVHTVVTVTPSADSQKSSLHINHIEVRNAINYITARDEYQTLWGTQWVCLGFLLKQTPCGLKKNLPMHGVRYTVSNTRPLKVSEMDLMELSCEDGRWIELAQDRVQRQGLVLGLLIFCVLVPES
jgi:hypothetical protein